MTAVKSYRPFIALGALLMLVGVGAGIFLVASSGDVVVRGVPTEVQVLGGTSVPPGAKAATSTTSRAPKDAGGLTVVKASQLPREAQQTLVLVDRGGPYPYARDGIVYQNRERILPTRTSGYYHEYTVVTPGESDRGARRIVAGNGGERYYTADHYQSFVRVEVAP